MIIKTDMSVKDKCNDCLLFFFFFKKFSCAMRVYLWSVKVYPLIQIGSEVLCWKIH